MFVHLLVRDRLGAGLQIAGPRSIRQHGTRARGEIIKCDYDHKTIKFARHFVIS